MIESSVWCDLSDMDGINWLKCSKYLLNNRKVYILVLLCVSKCYLRCRYVSKNKRL